MCRRQGQRSHFVRRIAGTFALLFPCFLMSGSPVAAADVQGLAAYLPNDINAVSVVRVDEMLKSPRAIREGWEGSSDVSFINGTGGIPSWVDTLVVGFFVRTASAEEVWATGVAGTSKDVTLESLAKSTNSPIVQIAGTPSISGHGNSLVLQLAPGVLGVRRPAVRQEAVRWIQDISEKRTGIQSAFLKEAITEPGHIVFAINLEHAFDRDQVLSHLQTGIGSRLATTQKEQVAALIAGLKDITLSITIDEVTSVQVLFEFSDEVGDYANVVKDIFGEVLNYQGAAIEDFENGVMFPNGKYATLKTTFSDDSLSRVMSMITTSPSYSNPSGMVAKAGAPASPNGLEESRRYYQAIDKMLTDLERSGRRSNNASRTAMWHESYARKIDDLPIQNVDPALIEFGARTASKLRALSRSLQGQVLAINAEQGTLTYDAQFNPGWASVNFWGGVGYSEPTFRIQSNLQQVRERQAAAIRQGSDQRIEIWGMLTDDRARILREMQQKFGPDFLKAPRRGS